jgi:hypothetical protein
LCLDVYGGNGMHGPAVQMFRCKGLRTIGDSQLEQNKELHLKKGWSKEARNGPWFDADKVGSGDKTAETKDETELQGERLEQLRRMLQGSAVKSGVTNPTTNGCRLTMATTAFAHSSIEHYDAYIPIDNAGSGLYTKTADGYCGDTAIPPGASSHAAVSFSSDHLSLAECQEQCTQQQCTCFDFNNKTAPSDSCSPGDFIVPLVDIECMGLRTPQDSAVTEEACAEECCALGEQCEVWQFYTGTDGKFSPCWIGKIVANSCISSPGWVGGGRPSPNQLFAMSNTAVRSEELVSAPGSAAQQPLCMHSRPVAPMPVDIPVS